MLEDSAVELLDSGCALIVGLTLPDGAPYATRGWGAVLDGSRTKVRFLIEADSMAAASTADEPPIGAIVAVTACSVVTLRSTQLKGPLLGVEPATDDDMAASERYVSLFFGDIEATDGFPRQLLEQMLPGPLVACDMEIRETFDQTPGPSAGARLSGST